MTEDLYERIVDGLNALHGAHPGFRAAHAKGIFCSGRFTPAAGAQGLSTAAHLQGDAVEVTARFSNGGGDPKSSDSDRREGRGLAVKFHLPGDEATDIVSITIPVFFVSNPDDFLELLGARKPDPETGKPDMEKLGAFVAAHPETGAAFQLILPTLVPPVSYATREYNGLHAFAMTNAAGERRYVRYRWEPEAGVANLAEDDIDSAGDDYLQEELGERLASEPVAFTLYAIVAEEGDPLEDPTVPWPPEREKVELGRLELDAIVEDAEAEGVIVFDPVNVTEGIEPSDDQILHARSKAYSVSVDRRIAASA